ncbi:MAG: class I SAM-dependent RNA methyltransferase [Dehalococcoidia bacterium]
MARRQRNTPPQLDNVVLQVGPMVSGGRSLARLEDGRVCLVAFAVEGETVEVRFEKEHADYLEAEVVRVVEPSPQRVAPRCPVFGTCGGCQLQHLAYPAQLDAKRAIVREQLERIGGFRDIAVEPTIGMETPWVYRNHIRLSTGQRDGDVGFVPRTRRGLLRIEHCDIADPLVNRLLPSLQGKGRGLHQVQIRNSPETGSYLVSPYIPGLEIESGQQHYIERLAGFDFRVHQSSFFQTNAVQADRLVELVARELPEHGRLLVDAYAGVGTFARIFAGRFEQVIAIEESATAMDDAKENLAGVPNVAICPGKVEQILPSLEIHPDVVLVDPARPGCAPGVIDAIAGMAPALVVYVSCNPSTLARDLRRLVDSGYNIERVTPIDMFPHTAHIECVVRLERVSG